MGMILFTQSGTFKPSDHGLSVGDAIQVLAIGGGAGGRTYSATESAGSASSLGTIITAAGGTTRVYAGGALGSVVPTGTSTSQSIYFAGQGGNGWMPGYVMPASWSTIAVAMAVVRGLLNPATGLLPATMSLAVGASPSFLPVPIPPMHIKVANSTGHGSGDGSDARTDARGGCGGYRCASSNPASFVGGIGGYGYGAGGGGCMDFESWSQCNGGGAGTLVSSNLILTASLATTSHTVTVGTGGTGGSYTVNGTSAGGGASGAVAVFW